ESDTKRRAVRCLLLGRRTISSAVDLRRTGIERYALPLRNRTSGAVGRERFVTGLAEARHEGSDRTFGQEDFDRESGNRAVWARSRGRDAACRDLRSGFEPPCRRRKRLAGGS